MYYINYFFIYSIIGHFIETVFTKNFTSGILYGFWTPIYGIGVIIIMFIGNYINKFSFNKKKLLKIIITYFLLMIFLSLIEFIGGYLIEFIFKYKFWDYSNYKFNIGSYVALEVSNMWGVSGIFFLYVLRPLNDKIIKFIPKYLSIIFSILFIIDITCTIIFK